jgi:hypothetical protein
MGHSHLEDVMTFDGWYHADEYTNLRLRYYPTPTSDHNQFIVSITTGHMEKDQQPRLRVYPASNSVDVSAEMVVPPEVFEGDEERLKAWAIAIWRMS